MLIPVSSRRQPSSGWWPRTSGMCTSRIAAIRNRYVAALTRNSCGRRRRRPAASTAASAGPSTRLALIITEFRLTAPARSAAVDEQRHAGLERRRVEGVADADHAASTANSVHSGASRGDEDGQHDAERQLHRLHHDQERPAREPVGQHAGGDRQQQQRPELGEHEQADERRRLGAVLDVGRQREVLHPRADVGGEQAEPDQPEVAVRRARPGRCRAGVGGGGRGRVLTST